MLELRLTVDAKGIASMRDAVVRECARSKAGAEHAAEIVLVVEQLVGVDERVRRGLRARRPRDVFVIVSVQSDVTMLMVRDPRPDRDGLGECRQQVLRDHTSGWSTMAGRDGRTVWADVPRVPRVATAPTAPIATPEPPAAQASATPSPSRTTPPVVVSA